MNLQWWYQEAYCSKGQQYTYKNESLQVFKRTKGLMSIFGSILEENTTDVTCLVSLHVVGVGL